ncbi:transmembrane protein [Capsaspora owczarzaki ATCC 30864]|uniref:Transmembrane protein n=1 Tax=Capsaspora owczarzaki (strain ATCC 30864) TaxID=595528 RepID=A0A0D2VYN6_CAPO3|nr:transmembrane protein [Capsaspora owczarzaki ATCC 30864]KJE96852.1 transmembrane protein [Capsaspora owczarzaki ATCC 30864]|eukprot:XP_004343837.1 transmembrane protein [Capsaspora owczarzaki ATCC 30864]
MVWVYRKRPQAHRSCNNYVRPSIPGLPVPTPTPTPLMSSSPALPTAASPALNAAVSLGQQIGQHQPHLQQPHRPKIVNKLIAGGIAGIVGVSVIFPLDLVKTRLQNQKMLPGMTELPYKSVGDCFRKIIRTEGGVPGLYRGLIPNLVGVVPEKAIKLAVNDYLRELFQGNSPTIPLWKEMAAGAGAGLCQVVATAPMERLKIQMQIAGGNVSAWQIIKSLGFKGMYKGTGATLLRDVPFSFIFFPLNQQLKRAFTPEGQANAPFPRVLLAGLIAGMVAAGSVTPLDVIKTRIQTVPKPGDPVYHGVPDCVRQIVRNEGFSAFFKGAVPRMLIISPLFGIALSVYEIQQRYFG